MFYAKEIKHPSMSSRGGEHIFFTLSCGPGWPVSYTHLVKVVLDGGNGAGGEICADILTKLGATVIPMFCEPDGDFPNHHPDPVVEANMQALMARVKEEKADLGIGLDGDADRLGIVDPDGRLLFGDEVLSLYALSLIHI